MRWLSCCDSVVKDPVKDPIKIREMHEGPLPMWSALIELSSNILVDHLFAVLECVLRHTSNRQSASFICNTPASQIMPQHVPVDAQGFRRMLCQDAEDNSATCVAHMSACLHRSSTLWWSSPEYLSGCLERHGALLLHDMFCCHAGAGKIDHHRLNPGTQVCS